MAETITAEQWKVALLATIRAEYTHVETWENCIFPIEGISEEEFERMVAEMKELSGETH